VSGKKKKLTDFSEQAREVLQDESNVQPVVRAIASASSDHCFGARAYKYHRNAPSLFAAISMASSMT